MRPGIPGSSVLCRLRLRAPPMMRPGIPGSHRDHNLKHLRLLKTKRLVKRTGEGLLRIPGNIMPIAKKLAEKVLMNCALKLKPYLTELLKGIYAPVSDYSQIVAAICQGNLDTSMQNEMNASYETQVGNGDSIASKLKTELSHHGSQLRDANGATLGDFDILDSGAAAKLDGRSEISSQKGRGRGRKARIKLLVEDDLNRINDKFQPPLSFSFLQCILHLV